MAQRKPPVKGQARRGKGFARTASLVQTSVRKVGESRGFAVTRLLTHWEDIVGTEIAGTARPVKVGYGREGLGATLTVLCTGAAALMVEMQKERIRDKVNACYGYRAISRVRITQTAPTGFAEGQVDFGHAPKPPTPAADPAAKVEAAKATGHIDNTDLRAALESLGEKILSRHKS